MQTNDPKKPKVVGLILAYRHAKFLEALLPRIPMSVIDEVIITDDNTGDGMPEEAARLGVTCYTHDRLNYGGNLKFGLQKALEHGADYVVEIHADGQYDPAAAIEGVPLAIQGYDFVMGSRFVHLLQPLKDHMPLIRYVGNLVLSFFDRIVLRLPLSEFHAGFRIYSRKLIETVDMSRTSNDFLFSFEIIALAKYYGLRVGEVESRCDYGSDHSSISIKKSIIYAWYMFGILRDFLLAKIGIKSRLFH